MPQQGYKPYIPDDPAMHGLYLSNPMMEEMDPYRSRLPIADLPKPPAAPPLRVGAPYTPRMPEFAADPEPTASPAMQGLQSAAPTPVGSMTATGPRYGNIVNSPMQANLPIALNELRDRRRGELEDSLMTGAQDQYQATQMNRLKQLNQDVAEDPYTGTAERGRTQELQKLLLGANLGGFKTPQEQAGYERKQAEAKMNVPIEQARVAGEQHLLGQKEISRGNLAVQESKAAQAEGFEEMVKSLRDRGVDVSRISIPGGGSVSVTRQPNPSSGISNRLTKAEQDYENAKGLFKGPNPPAELAALQAARGAVLDAHYARPDLKAMAQSIMASPKLAAKPTQELIRGFKRPDGGSMSVEDQQALSELLRIHRGRAF